MSSTSLRPAQENLARDDLTRPIGQKPAAKSRSLSSTVTRPLAIALGVVFVGAVGYATIFGDRLGGIPSARVPITEGPPASAPASPPPVSDPTVAERDDGRRDARRLETDAGVSVTRPAGAAAPNSVIVTVPDAPARLMPAPDERVTERTRFGLLPKIGADGSRASDLYARGAGRLPDGRMPAGVVAIMVGGLGISQSGTAEAIAKLPPDVTLAFAPYGANLDAAAQSARQSGHEIMLQVPMEPFDYPDSDPGPHTLTVSAKPAENLDHLRWAMGRFVGYTGIVNYMGGKLTADAAALGAVLRETEARGLAVLDDGSSSRSRILAVAQPGRAGRADIVVDGVMRPDAIDGALSLLEATARQKGAAIGSATAFPLSVQRIVAWADGLASRGILLVPVSAAIRRGSGEMAAQP